jgi:hypothetical protein
MTTVEAVEVSFNSFERHNESAKTMLSDLPLCLIMIVVIHREQRLAGGAEPLFSRWRSAMTPAFFMALAFLYDIFWMMKASRRAFSTRRLVSAEMVSVCFLRSRDFC